MQVYLHKIDVLVERIVTFFTFTATLMTGLSSALIIFDIIEMVDATRNGRKGITQTDLVIAVVTEAEITDLENATLTVTTGTIAKDDENNEAGQEVIAMMIRIVRENGGIAVEVEVAPRKEIDLVELLLMVNR